MFAVQTEKEVSSDDRVASSSQTQGTKKSISNTPSSAATTTPHRSARDKLRSLFNTESSSSSSDGSSSTNDLDRDQLRKRVADLNALPASKRFSAEILYAGQSQSSTGPGYTFCPANGGRDDGSIPHQVFYSSERDPNLH